MSAHLGADYWHREWSNERGKLIKADARIATLERELSEAKERIETVRKKARDDALEEAAKRCESFDELHPEAAFHRVAIAIRALKDQPSGEA